MFRFVLEHPFIESVNAILPTACEHLWPLSISEGQRFCLSVGIGAQDGHGYSLGHQIRWQQQEHDAHYCEYF